MKLSIPSTVVFTVLVVISLIAINFMVLPDLFNLPNYVFVFGGILLVAAMDVVIINAWYQKIWKGIRK